VSRSRCKGGGLGGSSNKRKGRAVSVEKEAVMGRAGRLLNEGEGEILISTRKKVAAHLTKKKRGEGGVSSDDLDSLGGLKNLRERTAFRRRREGGKSRRNQAGTTGETGQMTRSGWSPAGERKKERGGSFLKKKRGSLPSKPSNLPSDLICERGIGVRCPKGSPFCRQVDVI